MTMSEKIEEYEDECFDWTDYLKAKSRRCHRDTIHKLIELGQLSENDVSSRRYHLHHIDPTMKYFDLNRYCEWRLEDVVIVEASFHMKIHQDFKKRNKEYGFLDKLMLMRINA